MEPGDQPGATAVEAEVTTGVAPPPPPPPESKKMKVLVAVDESEGSLHALSWVVDHLFPSLGGSATATTEEIGTLLVLHVQLPLHGSFLPTGSGAVYVTPPAVTDSMRKAREQNSANILSRALQLCKDKLVMVETVIMEGDPKDIICQAADHMQVDLVVVGSRGLGKLKRTFLGSVSDYVAHHVKCPVLIVKPPKAKH